MALTEYDREIIGAINSNNINKIHEVYQGETFNSYIFNKYNKCLFDKNAKYFYYFRGLLYNYFNDIKAKRLMKYNNPFIFLYNHFGIIYYRLKMYNKAKFEKNII